jgi:hypothetical protein
MGNILGRESRSWEMSKGIEMRGSLWNEQYVVSGSEERKIWVKYPST